MSVLNRYSGVSRLLFAAIGIIMSSNIAAQNIDKQYNNYDFKAGETTIFEDNFIYAANEKLSDKWIMEGQTSIITFQDVNCLSIDAYYTKLQPVLFKGIQLPDSFSIEYDTWLDNGYDGNPGIEIHLKNGDDDILITPNKHELVINYPGEGHAAQQNPEAYFGENKFYDRWVHIAISMYHHRLQVYLDQYKMLDIPDCNFHPSDVIVTGNTAQELKILLNNFRIATGFPKSIQFEDGKFITYAIKFDVDKADLKPESITVIKQLQAYLTANEQAHLEIGGHTDSDGSDEHNLTLSQRRADAVKAQLISMGIAASRLTAVGYGETHPLDTKTTSEAKAANRRVEFTMIK